MTDLERRVARLEAREQIRELVAEYSMAVDDRDIPTIARLFATDAVFGHADGTLTVEGSGPSWAHPVVIDGRLYLRYDTNLYCFDVAGR